ncbi:MAG: sugar ABC transporter permease [Planctomycetota bacterium]
MPNHSTTETGDDSDSCEEVTPSGGSRSRAGWLFCSPWILGFLLLFAWPFLASFYWSLCHYDLINPPEFVGVENYQRLVSEIGTDRGFGLALTNTLYYSLLSVPLSVIVGVGLAALLSANVRGQGIFRTLVFLPSIIPVVAASVLWLWLLDPQSGFINYVLSWVGVESQNWLNQSRSAVSGEGLAVVTGWLDGQPLKLMGSKDALVLMTIWGVGNFVVIYLAAIGDIPNAMYEAAAIDGAGPLRRFWHVTIPMLSPVIFFNLVMGLIRSVQTFASIYVLSEGTGEPGGSMTMISLQLFLSAFTDFEMGYASAMAWVLFVLLLMATVALFRTSRHWVHYRTQV